MGQSAVRGSRSNGYSCSLTACWIAQASPLLLFLTRTRGWRAPSATARAAACACTLPPLVLRSPTNFAVSVVVQEVASREHTLTNKITPNFAIYLLLLIKVRLICYIVSLIYLEDNIKPDHVRFRYNISVKRPFSFLHRDRANDFRIDTS